MANFVKFVYFVSQITVLAGILAHYPAWERQGKDDRSIVFKLYTLDDFKELSNPRGRRFLLDNPARNTFLPHSSDRITREWPSL
jgi:hypothetical protein